MKKKLETFWFQPYTPVLIIALIILSISKFVYPTIQKGITAQKVEVPLPPPFTTPPPPPDQKSLLEAIGKLIMLPADESPQVIPITQIEQFKNQPFFKNAKNGDILLIYTNNKKAILYDREGNRIIDVAPLAGGGSSTLGTQSAQPQPTPPLGPTTSATSTPSPTTNPTDPSTTPAATPTTSAQPTP